MNNVNNVNNVLHNTLVKLDSNGTLGGKERMTEALAQHTHTNTHRVTMIQHKFAPFHSLHHLKTFSLKV